MTTPNLHASGVMYIRFLATSGAARTPTQAHHGDAGWDLYTSEDTTIPPREGRDVPTNIVAAVPPGNYARIVGRSSTLRKRGLIVMEGIIDAGYRGELFAYAYNPNGDEITVKEGERIAQVIVTPCPTVEWVMAYHLDNVDGRGEQGFGSSGV